MNEHPKIQGSEGKLKVLLVCNNAFVKGNGMCTAIQSLLKRLRDAGVDARLMAAVNADNDGHQPEFPLDHFKFPLFEPLIYANGYRYAKYDRKRMEKAIEWCDVLHVQEAFPLEIYAVNIARRLNKPVVGTFHLFTENITANLGIGKIKFIANIITHSWRDLVYNKCSHIQCPTEFVRQHLLKHGFTSELRTISNGIETSGIPTEVFPTASIFPINILCIGRLSNEKDQKTLFKAMEYSRHAGEIQLNFAGKGPYLKKYRKIADKLVKKGILNHTPQFGFYDKKTLAEICRQSYLYIHCAWAEVEGLSCVEAIREGTVPVIAEGALSATSQFALDERSKYPVYDAKALAEKIDWWIEHREEHDAMKARYAESAQKYDQKKCTEELVQMYRDAIKK